MKIVADRAIPFVERLFGQLGEVILLDGHRISTASLAGADALIVRTVTRVDAALLDGTSVRFVGSATSGHDHVDTGWLHSNDIGFASAPGCNAQSVAEYVLSCLFVLEEQGRIDLASATVGIIGCGHVGSTLFHCLDALGLRVLLNDPPLQQTGSQLPLCSLDEVLDADVITLHVPLETGGDYPTRHLLNRERLHRLRDQVVLINAARGGVVDEQALADFMAGRRRASVVLDVWENEPGIDASLLAGVTLGTPHIAGYSLDAKLAGTLSVFRQACRYFGITPDESAIPALPEPRLNRIRLSGYNEKLDMIRMAVLAGYDVRGDAAALRQMLTLAPEEARVCFSELRNHYPVRRGFSALTVEIGHRAADAAVALAQLGFRVERMPDSV